MTQCFGWKLGCSKMGWFRSRTDFQKILIMWVDLKRLWVPDAPGYTQIWNSNFQVRTQKLPVGSAAAFDNQKWNSTVLKATDSSGQHTDLGTLVAGRQIFVLCTLNWNELNWNELNWTTKWTRSGRLLATFRAAGQFVALNVSAGNLKFKWSTCFHSKGSRDCQ